MIPMALLINLLVEGLIGRLIVDLLFDYLFYFFFVGEQIKDIMNKITYGMFKKSILFVYWFKVLTDQPGLHFSMSNINQHTNRVFY